MAHFARLDENNVVVDVHVVYDGDCLNDQGQHDERTGELFLQRLFGGGQYRQTSYNRQFRKNYAGIGYTYDATRDAFISPRPFPSWQLDETTAQWHAPQAQPDSVGPWQWNETQQQWVNPQSQGE